MSDATRLRSLLASIDGSAPAIQSTAGSMMKHYDRSASVAVTEWRNSLQSARRDQYLPLLYVANEVLQNSKRNRGNKFLEAFSPVLGQSLIYIASRISPDLVEKVRRTVKIWGDRQVFSIRYVSELLQGLEPHRKKSSGGAATSASGSSSRPTSSSSSMTISSSRRVSPASSSTTSPEAVVIAPPSKEHFSDDTKFSPPTTPRGSSGVAVTTTEAERASSVEKEMSNLFPIHGGNSINDEASSAQNSAMNGDDNDHMNNDDDDEDDDEDMFGNEGIKLDIQIDLDSAKEAAEAQASTMTKRGLKRSTSGSGRRASVESTASNASSSGGGKRRRASVLSTNSLLELWNQVASLQQSYDHVQTLLSEISPDYLAMNPSDIEALVGDELLSSYKQVLKFQKLVQDNQVELHRIATARKVLESQVIRYLPWLERALLQDDDDVKFCIKLEQQLKLYQQIHEPCKQAKEQRLQEEEKRRQLEEERLRKLKEEEERKKFMESAMKKETEAKPGMVWNKATGEYQYLETDESWRD